MASKQKLVLPQTYEELVKELGDETGKMMQFVVAVEDAERQLAIITDSVKHSGKMVFL